MFVRKLLTSATTLQGTASLSAESPFNNDPQLHAAIFRRRVLGFTFLVSVGSITSLALLASNPPSQMSEEIEASQRGESTKTYTAASNTAHGKITPAKMKAVELSVVLPIPPSAPVEKPRVVESTAIGFEIAPKSLPLSASDKRDAADSASEKSSNYRSQIFDRNSATNTSAVEGNNLKVVVQIAALASEDKAKALQWKLKGVGVKSYTENATTLNGTLIRVRVGPFKSRSEADEVNRRLAVAGLAGSIVTD
jgi:DedD protein